MHMDGQKTKKNLHASGAWLFYLKYFLLFGIIMFVISFLGDWIFKRVDIGLHMRIVNAILWGLVMSAFFATREKRRRNGRGNSRRRSSSPASPAGETAVSGTVVATSPARVPTGARSPKRLRHPR